MADDYTTYFSNRGLSAESYSVPSLPAYLRSILPDDKSIRILDFGCGFGQSLRALEALGYENLVGYDIAPDAIEYCRKVGLNVIDGRLGEVSEMGGEFDLIVCSHVLEHLEKTQVIPKLKDLQSLLRLNGQIFVAVPNAQSNTGCYWRYEDFTHHTLFTAGSLIYVLQRAGFRNVHLHDIDCLEGTHGLKRLAKSFFLWIYRRNFEFWNRVTSSSFHRPSPIVNSYEVKALARKE